MTFTAIETALIALTFGAICFKAGWLTCCFHLEPMIRKQIADEPGPNPFVSASRHQ